VLTGHRAIFGAVVLSTLAFLLPVETPQDRNGKIDWIGAALGTSGLIVFNVAWKYVLCIAGIFAFANCCSQAPAVGWSTPYEIVLVISSATLIGIFVFWEHKFANPPILPLDIWRAPSFLPLVGATLLCFMSFGTLLWYMTAWQQLVRHWSVLKFSVGWTPFGIFAIIGAFLAAWLVPRLAAQWILAIGATSVLVSNLLLATMPEQQIYWAQVFPTTIIMSFCPDFVYVAAQIIASNSVRRSQQGVAASLIGTLNLYGNSLGLGFAGTIETEINKGSSDPVKGYRAALFFGAALAGAALLLDVIFVRVKRDAREGWEDEEDRLDITGQEPAGISTSISHRKGLSAD
jgi:predicted MFS family arabinose efflux permease